MRLSKLFVSAAVLVVSFLALAVCVMLNCAFFAHVFASIVVVALAAVLYSIA